MIDLEIYFWLDSTQEMCEENFEDLLPKNLN